MLVVVVVGRLSSRVVVVVVHGEVLTRQLQHDVKLDHGQRDYVIQAIESRIAVQMIVVIVHDGPELKVRGWAKIGDGDGVLVWDEVAGNLRCGSLEQRQRCDDGRGSINHSSAYQS